MSVNRVTLIGYLGGDPEVRFLPSGQQAANFSVATDESYVDKNGGGQRQRTEIVALRVQFLGPPPAGRTEASAVEEPPAPADSNIPF